MKLFRVYAVGGRLVLVVAESTSTAKRFVKSELGLSATRVVEVDTTCMQIVCASEVEA